MRRHGIDRPWLVYNSGPHSRSHAPRTDRGARGTDALAHFDTLPPPSNPANLSTVPEPDGQGETEAARGVLIRAVVAFAAALVVCLLGYLATAVPGKWFPSASQVGFAARDLGMSRGTAAASGL